MRGVILVPSLSYVFMAALLWRPQDLVWGLEAAALWCCPCVCFCHVPAYIFAYRAKVSKPYVSLNTQTVYMN
jgi:hypothetical protein